jgi:hypothetical protein
MNHRAPLKRREPIERKTIEQRRRLHQQAIVACDVVHKSAPALLAGPAPETPRNGLVRAWRGCERRGDAMPDNVPLGQWSGSDAMDRLRVAIENHQKATERQTTTTRWLNVVMTALTILMAVPTVGSSLALCLL